MSLRYMQECTRALVCMCSWVSCMYASLRDGRGLFKRNTLCLLIHLPELIVIHCIYNNIQYMQYNNTL